MSKMIQIRHVPDALHRRLRARRHGWHVVVRLDMTMTFLDDGGATGTIEVQAPIIQGDLPAASGERPACLQELAP